MGVRDEVRKGRERARTDAIRDGARGATPGRRDLRPARHAGGASPWCCPSARGGPRCSRRIARSSGSRLRDFDGAARRPDAGSRCRGRGALGARGTAAISRPSSSRSTSSPRGSPGAAVDAKVEREAAKLERLRGGPPVPRVPRPAEARALGRPAPTQLEQQIRGRRPPDPDADRDARPPVRTRARGARGARVRATGSRSSRRGGRLARIYGEGDILMAEALADGLLDGLEPAEVAALVSTIVYESRERTPRAGEMPTPAVGRAVRARSSGSGGGSARPRTTTRSSSAASSRTGSRRRSTAGRRGSPLEDVLRETDDGAGGFRAQLQAAARPAPADRGGRARRRSRTWSGARARRSTAASSRTPGLI